MSQHTQELKYGGQRKKLKFMSMGEAMKMGGEGNENFESAKKT